MTTAPSEDGSPVSRRMNENLTALMFRMSWLQKDVAGAVGISAPSVGRKMRGLNDWTLPEAERLAAATHVTVPELLGDLPAYDVWLPRLDSNQQPFGYARDYRWHPSQEDTWTTKLARSAANRAPRGPVPVTTTPSGPWDPQTSDVVVDLAAYRLRSA